MVRYPKEVPMKNRDILRTTLFLGAMASLALVMIVSTLSAAEQPKPASPLVASPPESSKVDSITKVVTSPIKLVSLLRKRMAQDRCLPVQPLPNLDPRWQEQVILRSDFTCLTDNSGPI